MLLRLARVSCPAGCWGDQNKWNFLQCHLSMMFIKTIIADAKQAELPAMPSKRDVHQNDHRRWISTGAL